MNFEKLSKVVDSSVNGYKKKRIADAKYLAFDVILEGHEAEEIGGGDPEEGARQYARGLDFSGFELEDEDITHGQYVDTVNGIKVYYDYGANYFFFCPENPEEWISDSTGDKVNISSNVEGIEIGKDDDNNRLVETQTEDGSSVVKLNSDNEVVQDSGEYTQIRQKDGSIAEFDSTDGSPSSEFEKDKAKAEFNKAGASSNEMTIQDSGESVAAEWNAKKQEIDDWYNSELANGNTDYGYLASELSRRYDALREEMAARIPIGGFPVGDSGVDDLSRLMRGEKDPEAEKYDKLGLDSADDFNGFPGSAKKADSKIKDDADLKIGAKYVIKDPEGNDIPAVLKREKNGKHFFITNEGKLVCNPQVVSKVKDGVVVSRSARKSKIKDGGNLFGTDSEGNTFTNSTDTWRGVPGSTFIYHGEWADPEVWYDGHEINGVELDDFCWEDYVEQCKEEGVKPTLEGFDALSSDWFNDELQYFMECAIYDSKKFKKDTRVIRLNDSYASDRQAEFSIKPDDMFNILVNGETTVAAPNSGLDVNEYAKSMIKVFKDIAKNTGNKLPNVSYTLVGNDIIFKVKDSKKKVKDSESFATLVNNEDCGDKKYEVILDWTGGACDLFEAYAFNEEEALNYAVAWVEKNHSDWLMNTDMEAACMEEEDRNNRMMYVDATAEGAREPHWIWSEYLSIEQIA